MYNVHGTNHKPSELNNDCDVMKWLEGPELERTYLPRYLEEAG